MTVATATPMTPQPRNATNAKSSTILVREAMIRKYSGVLLSPMARRMDAK